MSGVEPERPPDPQGRRPTPIEAHVAGGLGGTVPDRPSARAVDDGSPRRGGHAAGGRPTAPRVLGVIQLKDIVKGGIKERFAELRQMGIKTVMITGDNPLTAAAIAAEAGVDDFLAQATPEAKLKLIRELAGAAAGWSP